MTEYVKKEDVLRALKKQQDILTDTIVREKEFAMGGNGFSIRRGLYIAIEIVKKVDGEWK